MTNVVKLEWVLCQEKEKKSAIRPFCVFFFFFKIIQHERNEMTSENVENSEKSLKSFLCVIFWNALSMV